MKQRKTSGLTLKRWPKLLDHYTSEDISNWSAWALAQADAIDPIKTLSLLKE